MFRHRPTLAAELLSGAFGVVVPHYDWAQVGSGELTPIEHRADAVIELRTASGAALAVVIEVQLSRDADKRFSWPVYLTTVRSRLRCPTGLLVICPDVAIATWCATRVDLGPGNTFTPMVLGPGQIPIVTDPADAVTNPELVVLSALAHGGRGDPEEVLGILPIALVAVDERHSKMYYDLVLSALPAAARRYLEELMSTTYEYQSDFARKYVAEGRTEGRVEEGVAAVLTVLAARGVNVSTEAHDVITHCTDLDQLTTWLRLAVTADSTDDILR